MKKFLFLLIPAFMLAACCNNAENTESAEGEAQTEGESQCCKEGEHKCHHEMTEEQKEFMAAWEDWANQTEEKKIELLNHRKECASKKIEEMDANDAKVIALKEGLEKWDNLSIDEKKALFDNMPCCHHGEGEHHCDGNHEGCGHKCQHEGEGHHCDGNHEGCDHKCQHGEGHHCDGNHEGCPNHKN